MKHHLISTFTFCLHIIGFPIRIGSCPFDNERNPPIYAHTGEKLVSTIIPGDLDIPVITNIHHVWPHHVIDAQGKRHLYLLVHAWNKGKYAVLKLEE